MNPTTLKAIFEQMLQANTTGKYANNTLSSSDWILELSAYLLEHEEKHGNHEEVEEIKDLVNIS
jgi:hypothetical protein